MTNASRDLFATMLRSPLTWIRLILGLVLGASLVWWAMQLLTPLPAAAPIPSPAGRVAVADAQVAASLFGQIVVASKATEPAPAPSRLVAIGAIGRDRNGSALIAVDGQAAKTYRIGEEITPGIVLRSIGSKELTIEQQGQKQVLALPQTEPQQGIQVSQRATKPAAKGLM